MIVEIVRGSGTAYPRFCHNGQSYLLAPKKGKYRIRLFNNSYNRRLAVVSVDGINILDGKPAAKKGVGYVLSAGETLLVKGWHRTNSEVAAFEFCEKGDSYSEKMGHGTQNTSVIGVAVYDERPKPSITVTHVRHWYPWPIWWPAYEVHPWWVEPVDTNPGITCEVSQDKQETVVSCCSTTVAPLRSCYISNAVDLGTAYGKREEMAVSEVEFDACDDPVEIITIRYAVRAKLEEWGVPVKQCLKQKNPEPFPAQQVACKAPEGWVG